MASFTVTAGAGTASSIPVAGGKKYGLWIEPGTVTDGTLSATAAGLPVYDIRDGAVYSTNLASSPKKFATFFAPSDGSLTLTVASGSTSGTVVYLVTELAQ